MFTDSNFRILIGKARHGDREAANQLMRTHYDQVMMVIRAKLGRKLRGKLESMDIYQTAMKSAFRSLERFKGDSPKAFMSWLSRIVLNDICDKADYFYNPKHNMDRERPLDGDKEGEGRQRSGLSAEEATPSQCALAGEKDRLMKEALSRLPEAQRQIIKLKKKGLSNPEIAKALGMGERSVYRTVAQALLALRRNMKQRGYGESGQT